MISFILNDKEIYIEKPMGYSLLDFIRYDAGLMGTKIGCREGDCGACSVMEGTLKQDKVFYKSIVSCLTPIGNVQGKHIVTIEGLNQNQLNPAQNAFVQKSATQCGFCTPGFIVSLTSYCLNYSQPNKLNAIAAVSGNVCRCTGYKSIERAIEEINRLIEDKDTNNPIKWLVSKGYLPGYFTTIPDRLRKLPKLSNQRKGTSKIIAGGTDLMVQQPEKISDANLNLLLNIESLRSISHQDSKVSLGASITVNDFSQSTDIQNIIPNLNSYIKLISSEPIRNMGTVAGNIVNASPIGDLIIILLALEAEINLDQRTIPLKEFYLGYKKLAMKGNEFIQSVEFSSKSSPFEFNFEKVSKRTHLDIASVNSAIKISVINSHINQCSLSMGGVSPIPLYLKSTSAFLSGKSLNPEVLKAANDILQQEISPISDIRGSVEYKRLLARQLFYAHFIKLFPTYVDMDYLR